MIQIIIIDTEEILDLIKDDYIYISALGEINEDRPEIISQECKVISCTKE